MDTIARRVAIGRCGRLSHQTGSVNVEPVAEEPHTIQSTAGMVIAYTKIILAPEHKQIIRMFKNTSISDGWCTMSVSIYVASKGLISVRPKIVET